MKSDVSVIYRQNCERYKLQLMMIFDNKLKDFTLNFDTLSILCYINSKIFEIYVGS